MTYVEKLKWEKRGRRGCWDLQDACAELGLQFRAFNERCLVKAGDATIIAYCDFEHVMLMLPLQFGAAITECPESLIGRNNKLDRIRWCLTDEGVAICDYLRLPLLPDSLSCCIRRLTEEREAAMQLPDVKRLVLSLIPIGVPDHEETP